MDELGFRSGRDERQMGGPLFVRALVEDLEVGQLLWSRRSGLILDVRVEAAHRRRGVATAMLAEARRVADAQGWPQPRPNPDRTDDGQAWARTQWSRLPRRAR